MDSLVDRRVRFSPMTLDEALSEKTIPRAIRKSQDILTVEHLGFDGKSREGQLVLHRGLTQSVATIFAELFRMDFPIEKVIPIVEYGWDDDASMADNNTSAFNYRTIAGTNRLSHHAVGRAIDINPMQNPHISRKGMIFPPKGTYDVSAPGTVVKNGPVVKLFKRHGFSWGGDWNSLKDYQHFEKI